MTTAKLATIFYLLIIFCGAIALLCAALAHYHPKKVSGPSEIHGNIVTGHAIIKIPSMSGVDIHGNTIHLGPGSGFCGSEKQCDELMKRNAKP